jgi:hypothetical protein
MTIFVGDGGYQHINIEHGRPYRFNNDSAILFMHVNRVVEAKPDRLQYRGWDAHRRAVAPFLNRGLHVASKAAPI